MWIDNDACPKRIREIILKAAGNRGILVKLVANSFMRVKARLVETICVSGDFNAADTFIADNVSPDDLVITADVPLADLVVKKDAVAINPRGYLYTKENIGDRIAVRNVAHEMRSITDVSSGPSSLTDQDIQKFANLLDRELTKLIKKK
ncbi:MAG: YaiI/YqxD family protein [Oligoflexales bacterium]